MAEPATENPQTAENVASSDGEAAGEEQHGDSSEDGESTGESGHSHRSDVILRYSDTDPLKGATRAAITKWLGDEHQTVRMMAATTASGHATKREVEQHGDALVNYPDKVQDLATRLSNKHLFAGSPSGMLFSPDGVVPGGTPCTGIALSVASSTRKATDPDDVSADTPEDGQ